MARDQLFAVVISDNPSDIQFAREVASGRTFYSFKSKLLANGFRENNQTKMITFGGENAARAAFSYNEPSERVVFRLTKNGHGPPILGKEVTKL